MLQGYVTHATYSRSPFLSLGRNRSPEQFALPRLPLLRPVYHRSYATSSTVDFLRHTQLVVS